jgi:hypothetical protein
MKGMKMDDEPPGLCGKLYNRYISRGFRATSNARQRYVGESCVRRISRAIWIFNNNDCEAARYYLVCYGGSFLWMLHNGDVGKGR